MVLDTRDLQIQKTETATGNGSWSNAAFRLDPSTPAFGSALRVTVPANADRIRITYASSPSSKGLQWLTPAQTAAWLRTTTKTLYLWRRTGKGPPFHQGPDLVPSSRRHPVHGVALPVSLRSKNTRSRGRFDPVLYDRNQVVAWLREKTVDRPFLRS